MAKPKQTSTKPVPSKRSETKDTTVFATVLTKGLESDYAKIHANLVQSLKTLNAQSSAMPVPVAISEQELLWSFVDGEKVHNRSKIVECSLVALYRDYKLIPIAQWEQIAEVYASLEKDAPNEGITSNKKIALPAYVEPYYKDIANFIQANKIAIRSIVRSGTPSSKIINTLAIIYASHKIK